MISLDEVSVFLPSYLSSEDRKALYADLTKFSQSGFWTPYMRPPFDDKLLQGDGVHGLCFSTLPAPEIKEGTGLILSNSCDLDSDNQRKLGQHAITYCAMVPGPNFVDFVSKCLNEGAESFLEDARRQLVTNVVHFPSHGAEPEYFALLDRVCHQRRDSIGPDEIASRRAFTLSQIGHYIFLLKISIHFTRLHERINRKETVE